MVNLLCKNLTYNIIGAAMEVQSILGPGFLEAVYEKSLAHEFTLRNVSYERQKSLPVIYKEIMAKEYVCDFLVEGKILVELKSIRVLTEIEEAQIQNYLVATKIKLGLLINFGEMSLKYKRIIR